jgi:hypothetical protein
MNSAPAALNKYMIAKMPVIDRRYSFARLKIASICLCDARCMANDKIIPRTSRRGALIV